MKNLVSYSTGLLALTTVLISSDGEISEKELDYVQKIRVSEGIPDALFNQFRTAILGKSEREVYQIGIDAINACSEDLKTRAFVKMYQMAHADGVIHVKEVRLLLYAVKTTNVNINTVMMLAEAQAEPVL
ncbi:MAG TPA: TerB family tellurite resistance protein [Cyclobacteriaceae bacterium]|nr:TerB family tellurite resistance protein [Cyclobacteriaceae bacterium]